MSKYWAGRPNTSQVPQKAGGIVVEIFWFVGVVCLAFLELISVMYLNLLESVLIKDDDNTGHSPYLAFLKLISYNHGNHCAQQETTLENDCHLDANEHVDDSDVQCHSPYGCHKGH